jgi:hypothetical protein
MNWGGGGRLPSLLICSRLCAHSKGSQKWGKEWRIRRIRVRENMTHKQRKWGAGAWKEKSLVFGMPAFFSFFLLLVNNPF